MLDKIRGHFGGARAIISSLGLLFVVRILAPQWTAGFDPQFPDSWSYIDAARPGPFSLDFWFGQRPPGMSALVWLTGSSPRLFVLVQTLLYAASFVLFADRLLKSASSRLVGWLLAAVVLAIAAQPRFAMWNGEILSESLSVSLGLLAILAWWNVVERTGRVAVATIVTVVWLMVRDVNVVPVAVLGIVLVVMGATKLEAARARAFGRSGVILLVLVTYSFASQNISDRNQYGLMNNIGLRVLQDSTVTDRFESMGLPLSNELKHQTGKDAWVADGMMYSPRLASFRDWVHGPGQSVFARSLVLDAQFWFGHFTRSVDNALRYQFEVYDTHTVSPRLLDPIPLLGGPRSDAQAALMLVLVVGVAVALIRGRRHAEALFLLVLSGVVLTETIASALGDGLEVQRHLVGALSRVVLLPAVAVGLLITRRGWRTTDAASPVSEKWARSVLVGSGIVLSLGAVVALEFRSQDWDPMFTKTVVDRLGRFGGTLYDNGVWHHGPLDAMVYDVARWITNFDTYWYAIAVFVMVIAALVASSVAAVAHATGASSWAVASLSVAVALHLTLSSSDYAGVIYSRNVSTVLLALGFGIVASERAWRAENRAHLWYVAVAVLGGLAAQTMLSATIAAAVLMVFLAKVRGGAVSFRHPWMVAILVSVGTIASAPAWYTLRGSGSEFWQNWWVMGGYMNSATGVSLVDQFRKGRSVIVEYYGDRELLLVATVVCILTLVVFVVGDEPHHRTIRRFSVAWLVAGWIELIISQRYSSHYFIVIALPTAMLFASTLGLATGRRRRGATAHASQYALTGVRAHAVVALVGALVLTAQCADLTRAGLEGLGRFTGFTDHTEFVNESRSGASKNMKAILDLVSAEGDPLLAWTMFPWTYLEFHRVSATRLSWKSFMIGEIYLARSSPKYVLKDTWKWFDEDLQEAKPVAYIRPKEIPFVDNTPFAERVRRDFRPTYDDDVFELQLRSAVADTVLEPGSTSANSTEIDRTGSVTIDSPCSALTTRVASTDSSVTNFRVVISSVERAGKEWFIGVDGGAAVTGVGDAVNYTKNVKVEPGAVVRVVMGPRSTVLVVDGAIVVAVSHDRASRAQMSWDPAETALTKPTVSLVDLPVKCQR